MNQIEYELFSSIFEIYSVLVQIILFFITWNIFYHLDREKRVMAAAGIFTVVNILLKVSKTVPNGMRYAVSAVLVLGYCLMRYSRHLEKPIFVLLLFYNFHGLSFLMANSIYQYISIHILNRLDIWSVDYMFHMYKVVIIGQIWFAFFYTLIFLTIITVLKKIVKKTFAVSKSDVVFLSVLNIVGAIFLGIVMDISAVPMDEEVFFLFDKKREMLWKVPVIAALICLGEISVIYIYQKYRELQIEKQKHFVEEQQVKAMMIRLEEAENFYGSIRRVRHEMKNHMTNIKGLVAGEKYGEVERYIEKLDETIQSLDYKFNTGNAVTDVIINDKYRKAVNLGISFQVKFSYEKTDTIPIFDIGIVLNNLLDNAIEGCEKLEQKQRHISCILKRKNHFLLIEVENSFDGILKWEDSNAIPLTRKQSDLPDMLMEHGFGLKNVQAVADRYLGYMDIKIKGNIFKVTVMLQQNEV